MTTSDWAQLVNYNSDDTPIITSVNNFYVSPKGGESLIIVGDNFGTIVANVQVVIDGVVCNVVAVSDTVINCTVG